jgi:hypothetical protein
MSWLHKLLGIRISDTDKTRFTKTKERTEKIKKERKEKEVKQKTGNKNLSG